MVEGSGHFQDALEMLEEHHPKIVLALTARKKLTDLDLRNVLLLNNHLTFDLCCNRKFASKIIKAENALQMTSNDSGLKFSKKCKIPGYKYWFGTARKPSLISYASRTLSSVIRVRMIVNWI